MDVRCEKCQTEYELDEARLKPGGVTVKCTNCGHMFKIRKRANTDAAGVSSRNEATAVLPAPTSPSLTSSTPTRPDLPRTRAPSGKSGDEAITAVDDRQWLIRLENGEQKQCRELATLQQWIVSGVVTRESLISRTGKTWKRIGDIAELAQYFDVADEARTARAHRPTTKPAMKEGSATGSATIMGIGTGVASAAGGTIIPDDEPAPKPRSTTPPPVPAAVPAAPKPRPITQPPPPPVPKKTPTMSGDVSVPAGSRATAAWASTDIAPSESMARMPSGPAGGKIRVQDDEPAFAGRVRVEPSDDARFSTGKVKSSFDDQYDDDAVMPQERGSRSGTLLVIMALLVMGAAAGAIYVFVIKKDRGTEVASNPPALDAAAVVTDAGSAAPVEVPPVVDASAAPSVVALALGELQTDSDTKVRDALKTLDGSAEAGADAMRAHLLTQLAQGMLDRASVAEKAEGEKLKKDAKQLALDASTPAQKAIKATPDDAAANLAMAAVMRLNGKPAKDIQRYIDTAKAKVTPEWKREAVLGEALALAQNSKYDDAQKLLAPLDQGEEKFETSNDPRVRFRLAMIAYAQNKPADAKPLVESILAAQPDHPGAKALAARLANTVAKTDPLPPEDPPVATNNNTPKPPPPATNNNPPPVTTDNGGGGDSYDKLLARANAQAESNCTKAIEMYGKALEQKPNGVEALTGMGYCHIDAKQYASAFSKFRAALAVSSKYEPALWGIVEAYSQQGRKEQALEAVNKYLDVFPGTPKAQKKLDMLGGGNAPAPAPKPDSDPAPTPGPTTSPSDGAGTDTN